MNVLMIGWEFPPRRVGGLGTHCYELVKELRNLANVTLILPFKARMKGVKILSIPSSWGNAYQSFSRSLLDSVMAYNMNIISAVKKTGMKFDVIHAHDWLGIKAGVELKKLTGKPLVITFHSTEWDRSVGHPWDVIENIEKEGVENADQIIAVSNLMKNELVTRYNADQEKIRVVYNGINPSTISINNHKGLFGKKIVLYLGRLEGQKNPEALIRAAKLVLAKRKDVIFIIAGAGGLLPRLAELAVKLGVKDNVIFTGKVSEEEKNFLYSIAHVFVLPSFSEPFGITVLEAASKGAIPIISKRVGAGEQLHALTVDSWDVNKLADYILAVLKYPVLADHLKSINTQKLLDLSWERVARQVMKVYRRAMNWM